MTSNLVNWREWGPDAFAESEREDKLVIVDISAVWCHWCHVMDETSYSDPGIASIINDRYIPVRVDTDRMPDVNERYNMGGWPTTAIMTHTGEVLLGATYVPPDKLKEALTSLDAFYHENKDELFQRIKELKAKKAEEYKAALDAAPGAISENIVAYVLGEIDRNYEPVFGGFGDEPKFPMTDALDLLLTAYIDTDRLAYLEMAEKTMTGMSSYGMYDQEMGGFFRYSVTKDWTVPHFEKMTDSNAGLLVNCVNLYRVTGSQSFLDTIKKTLDYIDNWLWLSGQDGSWFCGSQDADEVYYTLPLAERMVKKHPFVDTTMYTNLNARMSVAYLAAWEALGDASYRDKAFAALEFVLSIMKGEGGGLYHYYDGKPNRFGLLTDQSAMVKALLYAFQLTGDKKWLSEALSLAGFMEKSLWDAERGGFFDLPEDPGAIAALAYRVKPIPENSEMAMSLKTLSLITGEKRYSDMAEKCLVLHAKGYRDFSFMASNYALAVDYFLKPAVELNIVGDMDAPDTASLIKAAFSVFVPRRAMRVLDYVRDKDEILYKGFQSKGPAAAYICRGTVCTARVAEPDRLRAKLIENISKSYHHNSP